MPTQGTREGMLKLTGQVGSLGYYSIPYVYNHCIFYCCQLFGKILLKPQLGSVMRESAELALSWIRFVQSFGYWTILKVTAKQFLESKMTRSHADLLGLEGHNLVNGNDLHLHFPAGAVEKVVSRDKRACKLGHTIHHVTRVQDHLYKGESKHLSNEHLFEKLNYTKIF